jgi:hypothetical protein
MGATDGTLQKVAVGFAKRPVNISFVSQMILPLFFRFKIKSPGKEQPGSA